jgi:hypothetical protein
MARADMRGRMSQVLGHTHLPVKLLLDVKIRVSLPNIRCINKQNSAVNNNKQNRQDTQKQLGRSLFSCIRYT